MSSVDDPLELSTRKLLELNLIPSTRLANNPFYQTKVVSSTTPMMNFAPELHNYPNWKQIIESNDIQRPGTQQQVSSVNPAGAGNSPLVITLVGLSLFISVALIVVAILGSSSSPLKRSPLDK